MAEPPATETIDDVWSRAGFKYRTRAIVLLVINILLFAGLGCFAYWLRTGVVFAPAQADYAVQFKATFSPSFESDVTLSSLLTFPISVEQVPMQIVILGLLLAALVSIPILVSILYRFPASLPFLAVVAFLAMMPWLAITLVGSCILASVRRFRFQFRYASALLGLVLVIVYFIFASQQVAAPVASLENPADRIKFIAPWILAAVASCALMAFVLFIAAMVNYRPGAIAPLLALMFVIPVALFEFNVGRDELHYRLLEHDYATHFAETDLAASYEETVQAAWLARSPPRPPREQVAAAIELAWQLRLDEVVSPRVAQHCYEVVQRADRFVRRYPNSRYAVAAVYLKAQALDMRVDQGAFLTDRVLRFYSSFPSDASESAWRRVVYNAPRSPMTAVALLRLALLEARAGQMDEARAHLGQVIDAFGAGADEAPDDEAAIDRVLTVKPVEQTLDISLDRTLLEARCLSELLEKNRDPLYGYQPIVELLHFDPRAEHHRGNLQGLLDRYPPGAEPQIADNLDLAIALTAAEPAERLERLEACARRHPDGDAQAETLFRLGQAYRQTGDSARARTYYEQLLREHADAIWRNPAQQALRVLPSPAPSAPNAG